MLKRTFITLTTLIIIGSLGYSSFLAYGMYERYEETIRWENSSLLNEIHQVPPSLARNYVSPEEKRLFAVLTDVNIALNEITKEGKVSEKKQGEYWELHDEALIEIENNKELYEAFPDKYMFDDFSLYIKADLAIKKAYDELNVAELEEHSKTLAKRLSKKDSKIENNLFKELKEVSNDYYTLNEFSKNAIAQLGVVEKDILRVGTKVNKSLTKTILDEIEDKKLTRFSHIKNLAKILDSGSWSSILAHNITTQEYYSWKESQAILDSLLKANYVSIGSFKTVGDILAYDSSISLAYKAGYSIDDDSKVLGVYHNGEEIDEDLYIVRGASLNFDIDYKYTKTPEQKAREEVDKALESKDEDDIEAARKIVDALNNSADKKQLTKELDELDELEASIQREIDEEKERIEEEKRLEEEKELELEKEKEEQEKEEQENNEDNNNDDDNEEENDEENEEDKDNIDESNNKDNNKTNENNE